MIQLSENIWCLKSALSHAWKCNQPGAFLKRLIPGVFSHESLLLMTVSGHPKKGEETGKDIIKMHATAKRVIIGN